MEGRFDQFIERLRGLSAVRRWNFHPCLTAENVAEHSFWVGTYASLFAMMDGQPETMLLNITICALYHDFEESITGDLPLLVKREVGKPWGVVAEKAMDQLVNQVPHGTVRHFIENYWNGAGINISPENSALVKSYVKAADIFDVVMFCRTERNLGSVMFKKIESEASTSLRRMQLASVNRILDEFGYPKFEHSAVELPKDMTHL